MQIHFIPGAKGKQIAIQTHNEFTIRIGYSDSGARVAKITPVGKMHFCVPVELLGLAAGKDAWMRDIQYKCTSCGTRHAAKDMEGDFCRACVEKQEEENARLDGQ